MIKRQLGERGPVWWADGSPDLNRHMVKNTHYTAWLLNLKTRSHHHQYTITGYRQHQNAVRRLRKGIGIAISKARTQGVDKKRYARKSKRKENDWPPLCPPFDPPSQIFQLSIAHHLAARAV
jgi:hypothetical protein